MQDIDEEEELKEIFQSVEKCFHNTSDSSFLTIIESVYDEWLKCCHVLCTTPCGGLKSHLKIALLSMVMKEGRRNLIPRFLIEFVKCCIRVELKRVGFFGK